MARMPAALWATLLTLALSVAGGCSMTLVPPDLASLENPTEVHIVSHGVHSNLVLPRDEGNLGEYAFGEWEWFAMERNQWYRSFGALFIPSESALSRRLWPDADTLKSTWTGSEPILTFKVERQNALALSRELDAMIEAGLAESATNSEDQPAQPQTVVNRDDTIFVRREERYRLGNNCNHVLARWLEALNVRVIGNRTVANVRLREPAANTTPAPQPLNQ
jgi:hypothetical protein